MAEARQRSESGLSSPSDRQKGISRVSIKPPLCESTSEIVDHYAANRLYEMSRAKEP